MNNTEIEQEYIISKEFWNNFILREYKNAG